MLVPMRVFRGLVVASGLALVSASHADQVAVGVPPAPGANVAPPAPTGAALHERGLRLGTNVPPFRLERLDGGGSVGLPNARVTILVFLATWNEPAKKMLTPLQKIHAAYAARGIDGYHEGDGELLEREAASLL